jgi:hypothetical protein
MDMTESGIVIEVTSDSRKASCARNSAGQPASSLDEWRGGREGRTPPMDMTVSGMVIVLMVAHK